MTGPYANSQHPYHFNNIPTSVAEQNPFSIPYNRPPLHLFRPSSASSYVDLQYLFGVQDPAMIPHKAPRNRRRHGPGADQVKHRRTRSGCYTCRSRRVKCDEGHPTCERCKKGDRNCVYPDPSTLPKGHATSGKNSSAAGGHDSAESSSDEYGEEVDFDHKLEPIVDADESEGHQLDHLSTIYRSAPPRSKSYSRQDSNTPSLVTDMNRSSSPSTEASLGWSNYSDGSAQGLQGHYLDKIKTYRPEWSHLAPDLQFYLNHFCQNVTHHHYALKHDSENFITGHLVNAALRNEALLNAIVGFSAFQWTLQNRNGKIQDFLQYYNKAVSLLLRALQRSQRRTFGTLLTMLQLATIEEYLGDWINLLGHQKAAYEILTELYTPQTVMHHEHSRITLAWYSRFDVFAGLMGGFATVLSREWFSYPRDFYQARVEEHPAEVKWKIDEALAHNRLIAMDMSILFSKMSKGEINMEDFMAENAVITEDIDGFEKNLDPQLRDPKYLITDFSEARPVEEDDIVDPYKQGTLYHGPIWATNMLLIDWCSISLMHKYQTALTMQTQPSEELTMTALQSCQIFEAIQYWPGSPKGSILACQASLGIAGLFLPRDTIHAMWCRRKLAAVEAEGYIYPLTFRTKMAALFQDPSCMHWWLPNDEHYTPIIRSIRTFVEERTSPAKDDSTHDLREMKAIFSSLRLDDRREDSACEETAQSNGIEPGPGLAQQFDPDGNDGDRVGREANPPSTGDAFQLGFDAGQGFWGDGQGGGAFGIPKPDDQP